VLRAIRIAGIAVIVIASILALQGCDHEGRQTASRMTGGNPSAGKQKIECFGCAACHEIPGVDIARGRVGPSLEHIRSRSYLAGKLPNSPQSMVAWIQKPQDYLPHTAMPNMGISEADARDITAYLYSLD
jgi:cytochrome c